MESIKKSIIEVEVQVIKASFKKKFGSEMARCINFYGDEERRADFTEIYKLGVNWSACGTMSPEFTTQFAKALTYAANKAQNFKYNGYEVSYEPLTEEEKKHVQNRLHTAELIWNSREN